MTGMIGTGKVVALMITDFSMAAAVIRFGLEFSFMIK